MHIRIRQSLAIVVTLLVVFGLWMSVIWLHFQYAALPIQAVSSIKIPPKTGIRHFSHVLYQRGLITYPRLFVWINNFNGDAKKLKLGEYRLKPGMSGKELMHQVTSGKGMVSHKITLIEGWTFTQVRRALGNDSNFRHQVSSMTDKQVMAALGATQQHPEGEFFPDTYRFVWGNSDLTVLRQAYKKMQQALSKQWSERAPGLFYKDSYQALIVASMIEKETAVGHERDQIAGVMLRRIKKHMRLQIDPTVLYGLGKPYGTPITKTDLRTVTPYNTYRKHGLPPTPISMPGLASIQAALHPAAGDALYYVSNGDGSHTFSRTYKGHRTAVKRYRRIEEEGGRPPKFLRPSRLIHSVAIEYAARGIAWICI